MDGASQHWAEERQRERDLRFNVLMDDGKWMFPVKIRREIIETKGMRIEIKDEQVGKYRCLNESIF